MPDALVVAGVTTAASSGARNARRLGADLGVRHLLTGSVRRDGERIEVNVQMARTDNGGLMWSERFEYGSAADWNWVRDVSSRVAAALEVKLNEAMIDPARVDARSSRAMDEWMRGLYLMLRARTRDELLVGRQHLEAAVAADPQSVNALTALAGTYLRELLMRWSPSVPLSLASAKEYATRALAIDPNHSMALSLLGGAYAFAGDFDNALPLLRHALQVEPNSAIAHRDMAMLMYYTLRFDELNREVAMALRLAPMDRDTAAKVLSMRGSAEMMQGHDEQAYQTLRASVRADPRFPGARTNLIAAAALSGRIEEAHRLVAELMHDRPDMTIAGVRRGRFVRNQAFMAANARYYEGMRMAGLPEGEPAIAAAPAQNRK